MSNDDLRKKKTKKSKHLQFVQANNNQVDEVRKREEASRCLIRLREMKRDDR